MRTVPPQRASAARRPTPRVLFKSISATLNDLDAKEGVVDVYWSAFDNEDSDGDVIRRGAYARTLSEWGPGGANRIKFLWQHDAWEPIGVPTELVEDDRGLRAVVKVAPTQRGRDALLLYDAGVLNEHSVGIEVLRRDDADRRVILDVRLWEGSVVTWGANPLTPLLGMKGASGAAGLDRLTKQAAAIRKALTAPLTDDTAAALETAAGVLEGHLAELAKALKDGPDITPAGESAPDVGEVLRLFKSHLAPAAA